MWLIGVIYIIPGAHCFVSNRFGCHGLNSLYLFMHVMDVIFFLLAYTVRNILIEILFHILLEVAPE